MFPSGKKVFTNLSFSRGNLKPCVSAYFVVSNQALHQANEKLIGRTGNQAAMLQ